MSARDEWLDMLLGNLADGLAERLKRDLPQPVIRPEPFYTLPRLAELSGLSLTTWERVRANYPAYFTTLAGKPIARPEWLADLLELHKGDAIFTREMSEADRLKLAQLAQTKKVRAA